MDVQFSGAVDFSPLIGQLNRSGYQASASSGYSNYQNNMVQNQNAILEPLNWQYNMNAVPLGFLAVGQNVDVWA